jgi:hypothetical protein
MGDEGIKEIRLTPQKTHRTVYQEDGMPLTRHRFTTRTLWNGSCATFTRKPAWGIAFASLLDGSTNSKEGNSESTIRRSILLRGQKMATYLTTGRGIYSIGPSGKSLVMLTGGAVVLVDIQWSGGEVTERRVRVNIGVEWDMMCMNFDDARGTLTVVDREGLISHIYLV